MTVAQGINKITAIKKQIGLGIPATTNPIGTGTGYTTSIAGFPIGSTTIAIITGTGTVLAGDAVTFAGDTTVYRVYTGAAGAGNIVLEGTGLKVAIPAAATAMVIKTALFGAQILRRKTSIGSLKRATYTNDEIVNHQQSNGVNLGTASTDWQFDGLLSPGTYGAPMEAILRKNFTPVVGLTGLTLSITGTAPLFTVTRSTGSYLTDGIKIGDVVRITAGAFANAVNRDNNLLVTTVTALAITVITVNNSVLIAEAGIAASSITVMGKKSLPPITGHTDTLFTVEEWYNDLSKSELFPDIRIGQMDIGLPASGNSTIKLSSMGLGIRTRGTAQVYASPNSSTTSPVLTSVRGSLIVNGTKTLICTGGSISIKANLSAEGPVVGSNYAPDMSRGRLEVTGSFTALFDSTTFQALFEAETLTTFVIAMAADTTNNADFISFSLSNIKLTGDDPDDGEKAIIRTYPFTAQINGLGGPFLANDQTILSIQDSLA